MLFYCDGDLKLMQVVLRGCEITLLGDIQNQKASGHRPGKSALTDTACAQGLDQITSRSAIQPQLFYDFVILSGNILIFIKIFPFKCKPTTSI